MSGTVRYWTALYFVVSDQGVHFTAVCLRRAGVWVSTPAAMLLPCTARDRPTTPTARTPQPPTRTPPPTHVCSHLAGRDVKPENVVLEGGQWGGRAFLVDFGAVQVRRV